MQMQKHDHWKIEASEHLKSSGEMEGKLYAHIWLLQVGNEFSPVRHLYTIKNGEVYLITKEGELQATGDILYSIHHKGILLGKFDPNKKYHHKKSKWWKYGEIKRALKL